MMGEIPKPFEVFFAKKFESEADRVDEARLAWSQLSPKKQTKFIKKSEKLFDALDQTDKPPFHTYLSKKELELLMRSYGLPEKPPQNNRLYYIEKQTGGVSNGYGTNHRQDARNEASEKWKSLPQEEKNQITEELHQLQEAYNDDFFNFARNLPQERLVDYKYYLKKPDLDIHQHENSTSAKKSVATKKKENSLRIFVPHEIFIEKNRNQSPDDADSFTFEDRSRLRSAYTALSDKKKLKYIKKAEERYDSYDFGKMENPPLFTSFLSKNEVHLLFESYGMPESVPNNLSSYFMKKLYKSGLKDMKLVFEKFRKLSASEKNALIEEHTRDLTDYKAKYQAFMDLLPASRLEDYRLIKKGHVEKEDTNAPAKRLKTK